MSDLIHSADLTFLRRAIADAAGPLAVLNAARAFIASKYTLGQGDSLDTETGVITRAPKLTEPVGG